MKCNICQKVIRKGGTQISVPTPEGKKIIGIFCGRQFCREMVADIKKEVQKKMLVIDTSTQGDKK